MKSHSISRRKFVTRSAKLATASVAAAQLAPLNLLKAADNATAQTYQASGIKVGEVTDTSALVWMRLTAAPGRNQDGEVVKGQIKAKAKRKEKPASTAVLEGACPGTPGRMRVRYGLTADLAKAETTAWVTASAQTDFANHVALKNLKPGTTYYYSAETEGIDKSKIHAPLTGKFQTAPSPAQAAPLTFCVVTCQMYTHLDHADGFNIYPAIAALKPQFATFLGDNVYYDSEEPQAVSPALARYHWQRMYSLPRHVELMRSLATYWAKDDHDTLDNDSWPSKKMGDLSFAEGQEIFRQQAPLSETIYRTFRWGKWLQVWITDGRDFRSSNNMKDGPNKTIWGADQKAWLQKSLKESDATWKVLISPTPIVGPDRGAKNDNHANTGFTHEGDEIRAWFKANVPNNFFVVCGDRHWQYHSQHPKTGLNEFSVGAASDEHAGGSPGEDSDYHRFHRVKGGFLSATVDTDDGKPRITFQHRNVHGKVVYEWKKTAA